MVLVVKDCDRKPTNHFKIVINFFFCCWHRALISLSTFYNEEVSCFIGTIIFIRLDNLGGDDGDDDDGSGIGGALHVAVGC